MSEAEAIRSTAQLATRDDMAKLFAPRSEPFLMSNGTTAYLRGLNVEERARMMNLDEGLDALTIMLACGVIDAQGNPIFGAYKDALPFIRTLSLDPELIEMGKVIARLSGMDEESQQAIEGN